MRAPLITALLMLAALAAAYAFIDASCVRNNIGQCSFTLGTMG